jgi:putative alpha-1,2-mannosidase
MRPLVATLLALVLLALVPLPPRAIAGLPPLADPVALTDPMIGTGSAGAAVGEINNFPGPSTPFGMLQWSPDTADHYAGYSYEDKTIKGFSLTHASVGCRQFGDVPILPVSGDVGATPWSLQEPFTHAGEQASPGYYTVTAGGVRTELTTAQRAGQGRFTFPANAPAHVLVKAGGSLNGDTDASVALILRPGQQVHRPLHDHLRPAVHGQDLVERQLGGGPQRRRAGREGPRPGRSADRRSAGRSDPRLRREQGRDGAGQGRHLLRLG